MTALVGIIMGSTSDWDTMQHAANTLLAPAWYPVDCSNLFDRHVSETFASA